MKTTEERALELFEKFPLACAVAKHEIIKEITLALKEEQKITRHACAENLLELETHQEHAISDPLISLDKAHNSIMNTRTV